MAIQIVTNQIKDLNVSTGKIANNAITPSKAALDQLWSFATLPQVSADPTSSNELVRKSYVDSKVNGLSYKHSVRVKADSNIDLSGPGNQIDGTTMAAGDRFLATGQTTGTENGIYIYNGAASAATRSDDAAAFADLQDGAAVFIREGSSADKGFVQSATLTSFASQNWVLFSSTSGGRQAGVALGLSSNTFNVLLDNSSIGVNGSDQLIVKASGITDSMLAGSITNAKLSNSSVTVTAGSGLTGGGAIALGGSGSLAVQLDGATLQVGGSGLKIKDAGVGASQIAAAAVGTSQIADGSVVLDKLSNLSSGQLLIGNASNRPAAVTMSGDIAISNSGVSTIQSNSVETAMLQDGSVSNQKLASSALTLSVGDGLSGAGSISLGASANLNINLDGSTLSKSASGLKVAAASITSNELATASVATDELADNAVVAAKVASNAITTAKLADDSVTIAKCGFAFHRDSFAGNSNTSYDLSITIPTGFENAVMVYRNGLMCKKVGSSPADASEFTVQASGGTGGVGQISFGAAPNLDQIIVIMFA